MSELTAEMLAHRILDRDLLPSRQLEMVWSEIGTRNISAEDFSHLLLSKQLLTNFQLDKLAKGHREGFFYGKYKVLYIVGAGTFARVFRAVHRSSERVMAVKVLRSRYRNTPDQVELFLREARMGERLRHPNIVRVEDVSSDIRAPFMVMEFVEGQTLREFLKIRKRLDVPTALSLFTDIAAGLDHARTRGITHRDMKLSNVLITANGQGKLVDFGLATISEENDRLMTAAPNARSIDYVALERGTNVRKNDHRSDIYFAGCIFYHMLTGVAPMLETRDRLMRMNITRFQQIKPINQFDLEIPIGIQAVVNRAMCLSPKERYQEPAELLVDLKRAKHVLEKGGDPAETAATGDTPNGAADRAEPKEDLEGLGKTVLVVESQVEMQNVVREQLKKAGYRVLIISDPARALTRMQDDIRLADCAVFSTQELAGQGVAAFNKMGELESLAQTPAILLVDRRHGSLTKAARTDKHRPLLELPLKITRLRRELVRLIAERAKV